MKIFLTGKDGQLGFELRRALAPLGEITAVDYQQCNLADPAAIRALVQSLRPDVIVNPAAYTAVDKAETEPKLAHAVNAQAPGVLAELAADLGALLVHYSTDYVFDGTKDGFYSETDAPNPLNVYGATKLAGEQVVQAAVARHLIFRTSWVVGAHGNNFAKTMLRLAAERPELRIVADQFGAPTSAALLADVTAHIIREATGTGQGDFPYGLYHLAAGGATSWHQYACHIIKRARAAGLPLAVAPEAIHPLTTQEYPTPARRPANSRLDTHKFRETFGLMLPDWTEGLDYILDQLFER